MSIAIWIIRYMVQSSRWSGLSRYPDYLSQDYRVYCNCKMINKLTNLFDLHSFNRRIILIMRFSLHSYLTKLRNPKHVMYIISHEISRRNEANLLICFRILDDFSVENNNMPFKNKKEGLKFPINLINLWRIFLWAALWRNWKYNKLTHFYTS